MIRNASRRTRHNRYCTRKQLTEQLKKYDEGDDNMEDMIVIIHPDTGLPISLWISVEDEEVMKDVKAKVVALYAEE